MAVHQGVLETMSGGSKMAGRWTIREFVDIGGKHLRDVWLTNYHDELLVQAVGQEVAVSVAGSRRVRAKQNRVIAIRTPKHGIQRPSRGFLLAVSIWQVLKHLFIAPFLALFLFFPWWVAAEINENLGLATGLVVALVLVWWVLSPFVWGVKMFRAADGLSGLRPPLTESTVIA